jgi:gliding motility-associated-like protein
MRIKYLFLLFVLMISVQGMKAQVVAAFGISDTTGCDPFTVSFTDSSSGDIAKWQWIFGDGQSSVLQNPTMTFTGAGYLSVTLIVTESGTGNEDTLKIDSLIHVVPSPNADFKIGNNTKGCVPLAVAFTDLSTSSDGAITEWSWDMGDGNIITTQNVNHSYTSPGVFSVHLQVTNEYHCVDDITYSDTIFASTKPHIQISADITHYCSVPVDIHFQNNSTGSTTPTEFYWNFGNGDTAVDENPTETYTELGLYDVILSITDEYGCSNIDTFPDYIQLDHVVANFYTYPSDTLCLNQEATFYNVSGVPCNWYFGDGDSIINATDSTVTHTYSQAGDYSITMIAAPGDQCADTITKTVFVQELSASFIADRTSDCKVPFTANFTSTTSSNIVSWNWNFGDGNIVLGDTEDITYVYSMFGEFKVSLTAWTSAGCSVKFERVHYINLHPPIALFKVTPKTNRCVPVTLTFTDNSISSPSIVDWQWHFEGGNPDTASGSTVTSNYDTAGIYLATLYITNDSGCTSSFTDTVKVGSHQTPAFTVSKDTLCASDSLTFFNHSQNIDSINSYDWGFSEEFQPEGYFVYRDDVSKDTGATEIKLITISNTCRDTSIDTSIYVYGPIVKEILPVYNCDSPYTVVFKADLIDAETWDWSFGDGDTLTASTEDSLSHTYDTTGSFMVIVSAHNTLHGCDFNDTVYVGVTDVKAGLSMPHENCKNKSVFLDGRPSEDAKHYYFDFGDGQQSGWLSYPYQTHFYPNGNFEVTLIVEDIHACADTITDSIRVSDPVARVTIDTSQGCGPLTIHFSGDSSSSDFGIKSYYWSFRDGSVSHDSATSHVFKNGGYYPVRFVVYDSLDCSAQKVVPIRVYRPTTEIIPDDTTLCVGDTLHLHAENMNYTYHWGFGNGYTDSTDSVSMVYTQDTVFLVQLIATDGHGCNDTVYRHVYVQDVDVLFGVTDSVIDCYVTIPLSSAYIENKTDTAYQTQWLWNFGDSSTSTNYSPGHYYTHPDTVYVSLQATTEYGCVDKDSVLLKVYGPYAVLNFHHDTLCKSEPFTVSLSDTANIVAVKGTFGDGNTFSYVPYTYAYSSTGMMNVDINLYSDETHQCGLTLHDSMYVEEVNAYFSVRDTNGDTAHCSPLTVTYIDSSQGADTWNWILGDGEFYAGKEPSEHTYYNEQVSDSVYYITLMVRDSNDCADTVTHPIIVFGKPSITPPDNQFLCRGDSVQLLAAGGSTIEWTPSFGLNDTTIYTPMAFPDTTTEYFITVSSNHKCISQDSFRIVVQQPPSVTHSPDTTIIIGDFADLAIVANQENVSYFWTPSYGLLCETCDETSTQPLKTTTYAIVYEDSAQCFIDTVYITVFVDEKYSLDVPSAFTPNGDGNNDVVYVKGWGIKKLLEFTIYNRWGERVFTTDDINQGWDGTFKGKPQNIDTYVYYAKGLLYSGKEISKKGTINLFR